MYGEPGAGSIVRGFDVNPWKLGGFGMYSAPQIPCRIQIFGRTPDDVGLYELRTVPSEVEPELRDFLRRRRGLRNLVEPDVLAQALLDSYAAIDGVRIVIHQPRLVPRTGLIELAAHPYDYSR